MENAETMAAVPAKQIQSYKEQVDFAQLMAKAQILPKHLHGNPGNCLAVITLSQSWNMNPIAVGLKTSVIPRKGAGDMLMFEGQLVQAVINKSGVLDGRLRFDLSGEGDKTICVVSGAVKGETEPRTIRVEMPRTRNSPLWHGTQADKEQQLTYLASRIFCRRFCPEVLLGVYTREDDFTDSGEVDYGAIEARTKVLDAPAVTLPDNLESLSSDKKTKVAVENKADAFGVPVCGRCGGRGVIEDTEGKGPCPDCQGT